MNRALREKDSDCWINGRRRDHGAERAALPVWEGKKVSFCVCSVYIICSLALFFQYHFMLMYNRVLAVPQLRLLCTIHTAYVYFS